MKRPPSLSLRRVCRPRGPRNHCRLCGNQPVSRGRWPMLAESIGEIPHRHAVVLTSRRWRGGHDSAVAETRRDNLITTQTATQGRTGASAVLRTWTESGAAGPWLRGSVLLLRSSFLMCMVCVSSLSSALSCASVCEASVSMQQVLEHCYLKLFISHTMHSYPGVVATASSAATGPTRRRRCP